VSTQTIFVYVFDIVQCVIKNAASLISINIFMEKLTVFVTGASGNLGGAVTRSLLKNGSKVKALTRNPSSPKIQELIKLGAEIIEGDLNKPGSFKETLKNVDGIFCVLTYDNGVEKEKAQGKLLVDLAIENKIKHFVYSSVIGVDLDTGIPHWESKFAIENYIKQSGIPYTIIRPVSFYENFLIPAVKSRILKGTLSTPVKENVIQQFISAHDIGEISTQTFLNKDKYLDQTITIAAEEMDMKTVTRIFHETLDKEMKYQQLPMLFTRLIMGKGNTRMFKWVNEHGAVFVKDLNAFKLEYPNLLSIKDWIGINFRS